VTKIEYLLTLREGGPKGNRRRYSMSDFQKLAHAVWQCKYHIMGCLKYRFKIVSGALQRSAEEMLGQLHDWKKLDIVEMNIQEDHVHMVLSIPPRFSVFEVVGFLKEKWAIKIFDKHSEFKKR
jgi:putative transposase